MAANYTNIFDVMNDVSLYLADRLGGELTLSVLPPIARNRWTWLVENYEQLRPAFVIASDGSGPLQQALTDLDSQVDTYRLGNPLNPLDDSSRVVDFAYFLNLIPITSINLAPEELSLVNQERERVRALTIDQFRQMIDLIDQKTALAADTIGLSDPTVAHVKGYMPARRQREATISDLEQIEEAIELQDLIRQIVGDLNKTQQRTPNILAFDQASIDPASQVKLVGDYLSFRVVPFEISLESMAQKYLGDSNLWYELLTVNNLLPPYVDESGVKFPLVASAAANNATIGIEALNLVPVGTKIGIGSYRHREETRFVERSIENPNGTITLFLSGQANLSRFSLTEGGFVRAYQPGTTRSNEFLYIPLRSPSGIQSAPTPSSDKLRQLGALFLSFGIDIMRNEKTNDFMLEPTLDFKPAAGLDNVRQAILYALRTVRGELLEHPDYGVNANIGGRFFGSTDEALLFGQLLRQTLLRDRRFQEIKISKLETTGTSISLALEVYLRGSKEPLPLSFVS